MTTFKKGDRIRVVKNLIGASDSDLGRLGTVVDPGRGNLVGVDLDPSSDTDNPISLQLVYMREEIEKVEK